MQSMSFVEEIMKFSLTVWSIRIFFPLRYVYVQRYVHTYECVDLRGNEEGGG